MTSRFTPNAFSFLSFHEHDPSTSDQCIYITLKGRRCRWTCQSKDNIRAVELYQTIERLPAEALSLGLIEEYIRCNCCMSGNARHQDRIEDIELLTPLAERWLDEIRTHAAKQAIRTVPASPVENSSVLSETVTSPSTPSPNHVTTIITTLTTNSPRAFPISPTTSAEPASQSPDSQSRYDLRPRDTAISTSGRSRAPLTEFRAHIAEPKPDESVSSKIREQLELDDFKSGWLYAFARDSSPGYIKIGWTSQSVKERLDDWSKCGYKPNLLFSVGRFPHARRAETLSHYELIKEWRRERQCKAKHCGKSHQEWFEVSCERAKEVMSGWAKFMRIAEPYNSSGDLKPQLASFVDEIVKNGEKVTAKKLLEHYESSKAKNATLLEESVASELALKVEEQAGGQTPEKTTAQLDSLQVELPTLIKEKRLHKSKTLFDPVSLAKNPSLKLEEPDSNDASIEFKPIPTSEFSFTADSLFKGASHSNIKNPFKIGATFSAQYNAVESPLKWNTEDFLKTEPPPQSQLFSTAEGPFNLGPLPKTAAQVQSAKSLKTQVSFASKPPFNNEPLSAETKGLPSTSFTFETRSPFKFEPSSETTIPLIPHSLFGIDSLVKNEAAHEDASTEGTPADKKLPPEQIPLPPSPLSLPVDPGNTPPIIATEPTSGPEPEEASIIDSSTKSGTGSATTASREPIALISTDTSFHTPKVEPNSDTLGPPTQEKSGEREKTARTPPMTQSSCVSEEQDQADAGSDPTNYQKQIPVNEVKVEVIDEGTVTAIESKVEEGHWDEEETLVECLESAALADAALQIVGELFTDAKEIPGIPRNLGEQKVQKVSVSELLPAVQVAADI